MDMENQVLRLRIWAIRIGVLTAFVLAAGAGHKWK